MRIQKKTHKIMARNGVMVANKQILAGKQIKYTKGSTPENKISKKQFFVYKYTKMYWQTP